MGGYINRSDGGLSLLKQMEAWVVCPFLLLGLLISFTRLLPKSFLLNYSSKTPILLPPGPPAIAVAWQILLLSLRGDPQQTKSLLRRVLANYGPIVTLPTPTRAPTVLIADARLAHEALVVQGAAFAGRPPALEPHLPLITAVSAATYGPSWRALRRNLASGVLHPSSIASHASSRRRALDSLVGKLRTEADSNEAAAVEVRDMLQYAMFYVFACMCFGDHVLNENIVTKIQSAHETLLSYYNKLAFGFRPKLQLLFFPKSWSTHAKLRPMHEKIAIPMIRACEHRRKQQQEQKKQQREDEEHQRLCYLESLLDLQVLPEDEIITFCFEFLSAASDTTTTALEWITANITKHQHVQARLLQEMDGVVGDQEGIIQEEDLSKMEYLNALMLECLRRHPPAHFLLPHALPKEARVGGYCMPKDTVVHFMVGEMGMDEEVWQEPWEFRPERFLEGGEDEGWDAFCSREVKMMPFGAGRRMCPGFGLAMLVLKYFVANLVREFEWKALEGVGVDLTGKLGLTLAMKNRLRAQIIPRRSRYIEGE